MALTYSGVYDVTYSMFTAPLMKAMMRISAPQRGHGSGRRSFSAG
jgi:hypothetical protein